MGSKSRLLQALTAKNGETLVPTQGLKWRWGLTIIKTYADHGKSGLSVAGRDALQTMLDDVRSGRADFETILVYDISRWGRFQDADESAYYEYVCKRAGIKVQYCAEQFDNDGSPISTIVKSVKRAMAGEYSRELSTKVFAGQCRLIELGFRQGGPPALDFAVIWSTVRVFERPNSLAVNKKAYKPTA